ncbi:MAG: prepilin-type N-terminal cleavage/methylation domain-containing protein [Elainella sp. Prado103]|nr:prepilin-type N-terminal cleavage/methylation domain-containing protein [Elainella sp. Prado103]
MSMNHHPIRRATAGFTMVELLVVIIIATTLALIAAPGWLNFVNSRRAEAGREQIFQLLRQAQTQAMRTRQVQVVDFVTPADGLPIVRIAGVEQPIDAQVPSNDDTEMFGLEVLDGDTTGCAGDAAGCVIFNDRGNLQRQDLGEGGVKIVLTSPKDNEGSRRCVVITSLLGAMQKANGEACN